MTNTPLNTIYGTIGIIDVPYDPNCNGFRLQLHREMGFDVFYTDDTERGLFMVFDQEDWQNDLYGQHWIGIEAGELA